MFEETEKELKKITKLDELRDALNELMLRLSETNPRYPEYGYTYEDGKIIEVKLLSN